MSICVKPFCLGDSALEMVQFGAAALNVYCEPSICPAPQQDKKIKQQPVQLLFGRKLAFSSVSALERTVLNVVGAVRNKFQPNECGLSSEARVK